MFDALVSLLYSAFIYIYWRSCAYRQANNQNFIYAWENALEIRVRIGKYIQLGFISYDSLEDEKDFRCF